MIRGCAALVIALMACTGTAPAAAESGGLRKPTALVLAEDGRRLFVANRNHGTVTVVDTAGLAVVGESPVGRTLSALVPAPGGRLLATDERADHLLLLEPDGMGVRVAARIDVPAYPVDVRTSADGRTAFVASLWSRRVAFVDLEARRVAATIDLPFCPKVLLPLDADGKLLVADAFGGNLAVIDTKTAAVDSVRAVRAHNIAAMAVHPTDRRVLVAHQTLYTTGHTTSDDIHWGFLVTNAFRHLSFDALLDPAADLTRDGALLTFSRPGDGAGDPAGLAIAADGTMVVPLAGIDKVQVGTIAHADGLRAAVGRRPTAVAVDPQAGRAFVANSLDDTLSVVDIEEVETVATLPLGTEPKLSIVEQGERLFTDARISQEGWMSCQSCHANGHSSHLRADTLGDGAYGSPKRVPSLLGVGDTAPYAWNGSMPDLEGQIKKSVTTTMQGRGLSDAQAGAIAAYLRTLAPPPSANALNGRRDPAAIGRGGLVFDRRCQSCHRGPSFTAAATFDVGLSDGDGPAEFNPPSLRGVSQRDAFFHDGRAGSLKDVLVKFEHPGDGEPLSGADLADLIAFLNDL